MPNRFFALIVMVVGVAALAAPTASKAQTPTLHHLPNVTATELDGRLLETIEEQTEAALEEVGRRLEALGLTYRDVVVSNVFLRDSRLFQGMNGVYRTFFDTAPPTRATVEADLPNPDALIQFTFVATPDAKEFVAPSGLRSPALPYSWGIRVGNTLFVSGATSRDPDTFQPVTGDVPTQTRRVFGNVGMVLEAGGMGYEDLVSCKVFLNDP
ncbi:MAG: RidA family protein, partial [Gemmatimonadota bacterium]